MQKSKILKMVETALITALICAVGPFTIPLPFSPVPITLVVLVAFLGAYALGWKLSTLSMLLYILLGLVGLPVFSKGTAGVGVLVGPTGGYIIGYLLITVCAGIAIEKFEKKYYIHAIGMAVGVALCYVLGTAWFVILTKRTIADALGLCVFPFIPGDIAKLIIALVIGPQIRKAVKKMHN